MVRAWKSVWFFPVGLLGCVALVSLATVLGYLLAMAWGFVLFPHGANYILTLSRRRGDGGDENGINDVDTHYWRTTLR
jgi:hypothetical protein